MLCGNRMDYRSSRLMCNSFYLDHYIIIISTNRMGKQQQNVAQQQVKKTKNIVKDDRFKRLNYDPKFKPVPNDMKKVKVDKRFAGMLTNNKFKVVSDVDKYGRKVEDPEQNKELKEYYEMDQEPNPNEYYEANQEEHEDLQQWMQNYNEESDTQSELQIEEMLNQEEELWSDDEKVVKNQNVKPSRRLALCNYDWMNIKPADLMILFNSFKPATGVIEKVELYLSDFGEQRIAQQSIKGPTNIWKQQKQDTKESNRKKILKKLFMTSEKKTQESDIDMLKLRQYQKDRMKYYYAVICCDTKQTAQAIYNLCDGKEFQNSNIIDLRYVPKELVFPRAPEQICDHVPDKVGDIKNKVLRSIGHSHVTLSWQDPDSGNLSNLKKMNWANMKQDQYKNVDWSLYIDDELSEGQKNKESEAGDESEEEDAYRRNNKKDRISSNGEQMEIIFSGGFDLANKVKAKREEQAHLREEKRQKKKEKDSKKVKKQDKYRREVQQQEQQQDKLSVEEVGAQQKARRKGYLDLIVDQRKQKKQFVADVVDPRFTDVYKNPNLQIDPTNPLFNPAKSGQVFKQVVKRAKNRQQ